MAELQDLPKSVEELPEYDGILGQRYSHFRDVKPTPDSLYRATSLFLLDYFTHSSTPDLDLLYKRLFYLELPLADERYIEAYAITLEGLWRLREVLKESAQNAIDLRGKLIGCEAYMNAFMQVLRCLAYEGVVVLKPGEAYSEGAEEELKEIVRGDGCVDDVDLWGLAAALDVNISVERLNLGNRAEYCSARGSEKKLTISLATLTRQQGESSYSPYYPLYRKGWSELVEADFQERLHSKID